MDDRKRLYNIWHCMNNRCSENVNSAFYKNYKVFHIAVCEEWKNNFEEFFNWAIANGYEEGLVLDRIDTFGNYGPKQH